MPYCNVCQLLLPEMDKYNIKNSACSSLNQFHSNCIVCKFMQNQRIDAWLVTVHAGLPSKATECTGMVLNPCALGCLRLLLHAQLVIVKGPPRAQLNRQGKKEVWTVSGGRGFPW